MIDAAKLTLFGVAGFLMLSLAESHNERAEAGAALFASAMALVCGGYLTYTLIRIATKGRNDG